MLLLNSYMFIREMFSVPPIHESYIQADICLRSGHGTGSSVAELETVMYTQNETDGASVDHSVGVKISCTGFKGAAQVIGCTDRPSWRPTSQQVINCCLMRTGDPK